MELHMLNHSPQIVTNGLQFYYDTANYQKSWIGKPTTNMLPNPHLMEGFGNYQNGPTEIIQTELGTTGWYMNNAGSWNGCVRSISVSNGVYTCSAWIKYLGGHPNQNGGGVYVSQYGGGDVATYVDKNKIGQWQHISHTVTVTTGTIMLYLISFGDNNGSDFSSWIVTQPQIEAGAIPTGFVVGTRTATQCLKDLTGNNIIDVTNCQYDSNGIPAFGQSYGTSYIDVLNNSLISGTGAFTAEVWNTNVNGGTGELLGNYGLGYLHFWMYSGGLWLGGDAATYINNSVSRIAGTHCITVTRTAQGYLCVYFDGKLEILNHLNAYNIPAALNWRIGANVNSVAEQFQGSIHSVKVYNKALTADEVTQNFNAHRGRYGI